ADHRAQDRHTEFEAVKQLPSEAGPHKKDECDHHGGDDPGGDKEMVGNGVADVEDEIGEGRQILTRKHVGEDGPKPRHDKNHEHRQNADRHDQHGYGIEHGGDDFAFDLLGLLHELGQAIQHYFQHTAQFAGTHHVDVKSIEHLGMLSQPL